MFDHTYLTTSKIVHNLMPSFDFPVPFARLELGRAKVYSYGIYEMHLVQRLIINIVT